MHPRPLLFPIQAAVGQIDVTGLERDTRGDLDPAAQPRIAPEAPEDVVIGLCGNVRAAHAAITPTVSAMIRVIVIFIPPIDRPEAYARNRQTQHANCMTW